MTRTIVFLVMLVAAMAATAAEPQTGEVSVNRVRSKLFRHQYTIYDRDFCGSEVCVDFDNDGRRELLYASRAPGKLQMLNAADGSVRWSRSLKGQQQSTSAFDLDGDGQWEVLYSVSGPGVLYVCDQAGEVLRQWDSGDDKLGNSPVVIDGDGDGVLDGYFGTRSRYLARLNMSDLSLLRRRSGWVQCGCYTSAMDVDRDGRWDLFAGSGDDYAAKGVLHRVNPVTLETVWSFPTNDNASSADPVLVDIDGDGRVEIIKSVDNYKKDDAHDAVMAFTTDGTLLWKVEGLSGEDSPNVADLDGDGSIETGGVMCRKCFPKGNGDGLAAIQWLQGWTFPETLQFVAEQVGVQPVTEAATRQEVDIVAAVARAKRMPLDAFLQFGAEAAKRGKLSVARVPVYNERGEKHSYFDLTPDGKGKFKAGNPMHRSLCRLPSRMTTTWRYSDASVAQSCCKRTSRRSAFAWIHDSGGE